MGPHFTRSLAEILQSTLQRLEETSDLRQDDPAVIELKKHIVRAIAELEITKASHSTLPTDPRQFAATVDPSPSTKSAEAVPAEIEVVPIKMPVAPLAGAPEPLVAEPAAETTEIPLLAENGTITSN